MILRSLFVMVSVVATATGAAQVHVHPQGESLGTVHFPTSCKPATTAEFDRAVALLHSFEFGSAIRGFTTVLGADSTCAMAQWGIAMSRWTNPMATAARPPALLRQGKQAADAAVRLAARATPRERLYVAAVAQLYTGVDRLDQPTRVHNYERSMAELVAKQPADTEAKIFYAIALTAAASPTDKTYANQLKAGSILEPIWARMPNHPGLAHYIIHTYDSPPLASRAAAAAERYALIAPSAAHALHMPSHTFTRIGRWQESAATNQRAIQAAIRENAIAEALHASDYAIYAYLQMGQDSAARAVLATLPALAARFDPHAVVGAAPGSSGVYALGAIPARYAIERHDWARADELAVTPSEFPWADGAVHFARALGAAHVGNAAHAEASIDALRMIRDTLAASEPYWSEQAAIQQLGARAWLAWSQRRTDSALALMRAAAVREDATEKAGTSPGPLAPARELLGDMLMELRKPEAALAEYRTVLRKEPNRFRALYGAMRAASASGDQRAATEYRTALRTLCARADVPGRPELRDIR